MNLHHQKSSPKALLPMTAQKVLRYQRPMESVLTFSITQWYGNSTDQQRKLEYGIVLPASKKY